MESSLHYGFRIEREARLWLERQHPQWRFLQSNYRWKGGELDLVFEDWTFAQNARPPELVFVEVRARGVKGWIDGLQSVTYPKQRRLAQTIRHYLSRYRGPCQSLRLDIVAWNGSSFCYFKAVQLPESG